MSNLNLNTSHPFVDREQTYFLDRKLISIHSVDRDINKWPNSSNFEIELPENLNNVYSLRLLSASTPSNFYTFSNSYQNTKILISLQPDISGGGAEESAITGYYALNKTEVVINEGYYEPGELENELTGKINEAITKDLISTLGSSYVYDKFYVKYDKTTHKYNFINTRDNFIIHADIQIEYTGLPCGQITSWNNYANWGLPYNLGLEKKSYTSIESNNALNFHYDNTSYVPSSDNLSNTIKYVQSENCADIFCSDSIYVELDKYNSIDEITPYSESTNNMYNNDYSGKTESAFAKLPVFGTPFSQVYDANSVFLNNITFFKVPIPKIRKLKFKFRHHNGILVDFKNMPFSFTIEATQLIDEPRRKLDVNIPFVYSS